MKILFSRWCQYPLMVTGGLLALIGLQAQAATGPLAQYQPVLWEQYRNAELKLEMRYPYHWATGAGFKRDEVFYASYPSLFPSISIVNLPRDPNLSLADSGLAAVAQLTGKPDVRTDRNIKVNGTEAREVFFDWTLPIGLGLEMRSIILSFYRDDRWIIVRSMDGAAAGDFLPELREAIYSIKFVAPTNSKRKSRRKSKRGDR